LQDSIVGFDNEALFEQVGTRHGQGSSGRVPAAVVSLWAANAGDAMLAAAIAALKINFENAA
jgi:hypothetical protein